MRSIKQPTLAWQTSRLEEGNFQRDELPRSPQSKDESLTGVFRLLTPHDEAVGYTRKARR
jgi:hypothetical protein